MSEDCHQPDGRVPEGIAGPGADPMTRGMNGKIVELDAGGPMSDEVAFREQYTQNREVTSRQEALYWWLRIALRRLDQVNELLGTFVIDQALPDATVPNQVHVAPEPELRLRATSNTARTINCQPYDRGDELQLIIPHECPEADCVCHSIFRGIRAQMFRVVSPGYSHRLPGVAGGPNREWASYQTCADCGLIWSPLPHVVDCPACALAKVTAMAPDTMPPQPPPPKDSYGPMRSAFATCKPGSEPLLLLELLIQQATRIDKLEGRKR